MEPDFWHDKWERNHIPFHEARPNPVLGRHFHKLSVAAGSRVFVPLCGKTLDIHWLLAEGYRVAAAELSNIAVEQLFSDLNLVPHVTELGPTSHYRARGIDVFAGDIFELTKQVLGSVHAIYDQAALVALPAQSRVRYTAHLIEVTGVVPQLLVCFEYDQNELEGPPFSIAGEEVRRHYGEKYRLNLVESEEVPGGLKGKCHARESVWLLKP